MKPSRVYEVLSQLIVNNWPVFIWGPPGVGKSSIVAQLAKEKGLELFDIRASLLDPTDLRGIPHVDNGIARWAPPSFLPHEKNSNGLLFFDELNAAPPLVQASLYQLTLDRRVGEYELPEGWRIVAAGNRAEDSSIVYRMPAALANRFVHLDFEVNVDDWVAWALDHQVDPMVIAFIRTRHDQYGQSLSNAEILGNFIKCYKKPGITKKSSRHHYRYRW
jgi:MoxR-like ATPase